MKRSLQRPLAGSPPRRPGDGAPRRAGWLGRQGVPWWQVGIAAAAVVATVVAVWVTLEAEFLAYPGWLAAQKADFILGPVFIGLYWLRRRPLSRFGPMLIAFGFVGGVYVLQSSSNPWLYGIGLVWENVIYLATLVLILTFPNGRLEGRAAKLVLLVAFLAAALPATIATLVVPQVGAGGSISGCRTLCPENGLAITSNPSLAVGTPVALLFLFAQGAYLTLVLAAPAGEDVRTVLQWAFAGARATIWYGFFFALVAAQLYAGRALQRLVRASLRRPSHGELET